MPAETHVEHSPIGPDDVFRIIRERLAEILEIEEDRISMDSDFAADLMRKWNDTVRRWIATPPQPSRRVVR